MNSFDFLFSHYHWIPIRACPGRYVFAQGVVSYTVDDLTVNLPEPVQVREQIFPLAKDRVAFCFFDGGGLISYKKEQGWLHTLCDTEGMRRKMKMLQK
ncbi:MAG: hypothetical protein OEZ68_17385 [Gammaproteobacteria bacterium]|nr:hypothetical protein [Gammaproteobacteria bacterium]MDH5802577.1 hypothetical protein [Gammaproteobacteria bacterium]